MSYTEVKQNIWKNTVSNYVRTVLGMIVGLVTFRILYQAFTKDEFGFWSILWSVFGYGILLDFGFGFSAQKRAAELSVARDWKGLSQVISTILCAYCAMAALIVGLTVMGASQLVIWFGVPPENAAGFRTALIVFFVGVGLAFPMGVFPEVLRGLQRIRMANNLIVASQILRLALTIAAVRWHWSYLAIVTFSLACSLVPGFAAALWVLRILPELRISPKLFSKALLRETLHFSVVAYIITATNIVLGKTDQVILGFVLNVATVALYQAGYKIADIFSQFTRELMDSLSPAAAYLHASGDAGALRDLLVQSLRWSLLIATPLYLLCAFYFDGLLRILTGDAKANADTLLVGQLLLFWYYALIFTHGNSRRIFIMCGHEKRLLRLSLAEAGTKLVISVVLVWYFRNLASVAVGSLIPSLIIGWLIMWPWVSGEVGISGWELFRVAVLPAWASVLPMAALLLALRWLLPASTITLFVGGGLAGAVGFLGVWRLALRPAERSHLLAKLSRHLPNRTLAQEQP